jgi:hypothetical protein
MSSKKAASKSSDLPLIQALKLFATEEGARTYYEALRWPNGPVCFHCGNVDQVRIYKMTENKEAGIRPGLWKCAECRETFTATMGTIMEDSHLPLSKWMIAMYVINASKTQVSALQMQRMLELGSYRTAWHLCHRIRLAMAELKPQGKLDGEVEADETYIGGKARGKGRGYVGNKVAVVSIVERGGRVRSKVMPEGHVNGATVGAMLKEHVEPTAHLNTDESPLYTEPGKRFASHETVCHKEEEYARQNDVTGRVVTTNAAEGYFGKSKRSLDGTHHHVSKKYLPLYVAELDYKYHTRKMTNGERTVKAIGKATGKRMILKTPRSV